MPYFPLIKASGGGQLQETLLWTNQNPNLEWSNNSSVPLDTSIQDLGIDEFDIIRLDFKISSSDSNSSYLSSYYDPSDLMEDYHPNKTTHNIIGIAMPRPEDFPSGQRAPFISCLRRFYFPTKKAFFVEDCCCTEMMWSSSGVYVASQPFNKYCIPYKFVGLKVT